MDPFLCCSRLGEEKESVMQAFKEERQQFEEQVKELIEQQNQILHDRESNADVKL